MFDMKKTIAALLALIMIFSLTACGADKEAGSDDENLIVIGDYQALYKGSEIMEDCDGDNAIVVTYDFTNNSKESTSFFWSMFYTFTQNGQELELSSIFINENNDEIADSGYEEVAPGDTLEVKSAYKLNNLTDDVVIDFSNLSDTEKDSLTIPLSDAARSQSTGSRKSPDSTQATEAAENQTAYQEYWNGDWYGWWLVTNAGGDDFEGWDDGTYWWDCCVQIEIDENGDGIMVVWDEDGSDDELMAGLEVQISDGGYTQGRLKSVSGFFWDCEIGNADWLVEPDSAGYDHMILIEGTYRDPEDFFNYFEYVFCLRPWGMDWEDVAEAEPDFLPGYYESWYLPAIEAGTGMPDAIDGDFLASGEVPDDEMEPQPTGEGSQNAAEYGKSIPDADGVVASTDVLREGLKWALSNDVKDGNTTYEAFFAKFGNVHGIPLADSYNWLNGYGHAYQWVDSEGRNVIVSFDVEDDGTEIYNANVSWAPSDLAG